jgi:hypothetical protein
MGSIVGAVDRYVILQHVDGTFAVRIDDGSAWTGLLPRSSNEAEAEAWIMEHGRGTEYTVSRDEDVE